MSTPTPTLYKDLNKIHNKLIMAGYRPIVVSDDTTGFGTHEKTIVVPVSLFDQRPENTLNNTLRSRHNISAVFKHTGDRMIHVAVLASRVDKTKDGKIVKAVHAESPYYLVEDTDNLKTVFEEGVYEYGDNEANNNRVVTLIRSELDLFLNAIK